jgi:aminopeptidase N
VAVPNGLMNVSNGKFIAATNLNNGYTQWHWEVKNPINAYNITINIANYLHIQDTHNGLALDYYVLPENKQIATKHFKQVKPMLDCFEAKFGPYPFTEDGYKLIQTPYLGMEHQSGIAYGNYYQNGYLGQDLSNTGVGLLFDYIIVHESGHEWFGNSITSRDIADLWIHEGFTQYAEIVYIECQYGYQKAMQYANGLKNNIINDQPILGVYGTNTAGSLDCYAKGALLLNTLRHVVNNDKKWWDLILKYSLTYKKQIIDTPTVIAFFNKETQLNLTPIFNAYLKHAAIPKLVTRVYNKAIEYKWQTPETNFEMPLDILINKQKTRIYPTNYWKRLPTDIKNYGNIKPLTHNFYIQYH